MGGKDFVARGQQGLEEDPERWANRAGGIGRVTQTWRCVQQWLRDKLTTAGDTGDGCQVGARKMGEDFDESLVREDGEGIYGGQTVEAEVRSGWWS